jgi:hypothetical protein
VKIMRVLLPGATLLVLGLAGMALAADESAKAPAAPLSPPSVYGELAFSDVIVFDYNRDGTPDRVQFWIDLQGQQALGEPGSPGARPESGSVSYFVMDVAQQRRIDDWLLGFNMGGVGGGFPVAGQPYPLTNIRIEGRTARFEVSGSAWTITDQGDSWEKDTIEIVTGGRKRSGRFYGGDVTVAPDPQVVTVPADIKQNRKCNSCHEDAAVSIAAAGGRHSELRCSSCHKQHPREVEGAVPQCLGCHEAHDASMGADSCSTCHSSHAVTVVQYGIGVPDGQCAACHAESAARLAASGTRHIGLACALCHRADHGAIPSCVDCHGGPHGERVMSKPERCVRCHTSAHETSVDR